MKLYHEILAHYLSQQNAQVLFPNLNLDASDVVESSCLQIIEKIRAIIADDSLSDKECFMQIEEIISTLEAYGIDCGTRHDFG